MGFRIALALVLATAAAAWGQPAAYPTKVVRIVNPVAPGGNQDRGGPGGDIDRRHRTSSGCAQFAGGHRVVLGRLILATRPVSRPPATIASPHGNIEDGLRFVLARRVPFRSNSSGMAWGSWPCAVGRANGSRCCYG